MNRFETEDECNRVCLPRNKAKDSVCSLQADHGVCKDYLPRWSYDHEKDTCSGFVYGGCRGNANRFESCLQCMRRCSGRDHRLRYCILQTEKFNDEFYKAWDPE
ncbi:hypothetical protein HPB50_003896 [Hyalomma asiaticum]|uniref:Uncharacterized protein n=1 Tax=Hyalomma asiaticum TaxID=266040 RepID=A0ACB7RT35_HYAAI|nr:hypothetical protein HPB50_003896 [Hyalomma asiaticum]